jgi:hypothetical protein
MRLSEAHAAPCHKEKGQTEVSWASRASDLPPLARPVRRYEGRRRPPAEGVGARTPGSSRSWLTKSCRSWRSKELGGEIGGPDPPASRGHPTCSRCSAAHSGGRASWSGSTAACNTVGRSSPTGTGRCASSCVGSAGRIQAGVRRAHAQLREQGWCVNRKAVQRLWREEALRIQTKRRKLLRVGISITPIEPLAAHHPGHVCALDDPRGRCHSRHLMHPASVAMRSRTRPVRPDGAPRA